MGFAHNLGPNKAQQAEQRENFAKTAKADAEARQKGENLDGSKRRETVASLPNATNQEPKS